MENRKWQEAEKWFKKGAGVIVCMLGCYFFAGPFVLTLWPDARSMQRRHGKCRFWAHAGGPRHHGHFTTGGMEDRIESTFPPVLSPNTVPRS